MSHAEKILCIASALARSSLTAAPIALLFVAACASAPARVVPHEAAKDKDAFAREACGPYFEAISLQSKHQVDVAPVREALFVRLSSVRNCFLSAHSKNHALQGCVAVRLIVDDQQLVSSVRSIWNSTGVTPLADCVEEALGGIGYIQGARSSEYSQAFVFIIEP